MSAALAEPAEGIEDARPRLVGAARRALRPVLESQYIVQRTAEARTDAVSEWQPAHAMQEPQQLADAHMLKARPGCPPCYRSLRLVPGSVPAWGRCGARGRRSRRGRSSCTCTLMLMRSSRPAKCGAAWPCRYALWHIAFGVLVSTQVHSDRLCTSMRCQISLHESVVKLLKLPQWPCRRREAWTSLPGCSGARRTSRTSGSTQASTRRSWTAFCMSCMSQSRQHQLPDHGTPDCEQASDRSPPQTWQTVAALAVRRKQQPPGDSPVGHGACVPTEHRAPGGPSALLPVMVALAAAVEERGRLVGRARLHLVVVRLAVAALGALRCAAAHRAAVRAQGRPSGPIQLLASARCQTCTYAFEPTSVAGKRRVSRVLGRAAR